MAFSAKAVEKLLVGCHRHCCICHKPAGMKMEIHHIVPCSEGGEDTEENGIPLCLECHAEVAAYNPKHPKGRRFTPSELRKHKEQWFAMCAKPAWHQTVVQEHLVMPEGAVIEDRVFECLRSGVPTRSEIERVLGGALRLFGYMKVPLSQAAAPKTDDVFEDIDDDVRALGDRLDFLNKRKGKLGTADRDYINKALVEEFLLSAPRARGVVRATAVQKLVCLEGTQVATQREIEFFWGQLSAIRGCVAALVGEPAEIAALGDMRGSSKVQAKIGTEDFNMILDLIRVFLGNRLPQLGLQHVVGNDEVTIWASDPRERWKVLAAFLVEFEVWCCTNPTMVKFARGPVSYNFGVHAGGAFRHDESDHKVYSDVMRVASRLLASAEEEPGTDGVIVLSEEVSRIHRDLSCSTVPMPDYEDTKHNEVHRRVRLEWRKH